MNLLSWILGLGGLAVLVAVAWWDLTRRVDAHAERMTALLMDGLADEAPAVEPAPAPAHGIPLVPPPAPFLADHRQLLEPPPMIEGVTVRDWLINHTHRDGVWADVVEEFYNRAAAVPAVAHYFRVVLARPDGLSTLQRHFTKTLVLVTHAGVTEGLMRKIGRDHAPVRSSDGSGITAEVWDTVIGVLVAILREHGLPEAGIAELARVVRPFRAVIVRD